MDDQHKHIKGYRDLSQAEIDAMNRVKVAAESIRVLIDDLQQMPDLDKRWIAIGTTNLQQGFMALTRSIAQPTTF